MSVKMWIVAMAIFLGLPHPMQAQAADPTVSHSLATGECEDSTSNGQPVKICMDADGTYKIRPANSSAVAIPSNQLSQDGIEWSSAPQIHAGQEKTTAPISCEDFLDPARNYDKKLEELVKQTGLPDGKWDKFHVAILLCHGWQDDLQELNHLVDDGDVSGKIVETVAHALDKDYKAPSRTPEGELYEKINKGLAAKGLCEVCASNIANSYVENNNKNITKWVDATLSGDEDALQKLQKGNYIQPIPKDPLIDSKLKTVHTCFIRSISKDETQAEAIINCIDLGISWCNKMGMKTSDTVKISPVSGQIIIDNFNCARSLPALYDNLSLNYQTELHDYESSESMREPYTPVFFDIRDFPKY